MKHTGFIAAAVFVAAAALQAQTVYELDKDHSSITFRVSHMVISKVSGQFDDFNTDIRWDLKNPGKSFLNAAIKTSSVNTSHEKRDAHLRSPDFFDTDKFPDITFKSTKVEKKGSSFYLTGELTIRGVTKTLTAPFFVLGPVKDPWGKTRLGFEGKFKIDRTDYGLTWNKPLESGGLLVGNEVEIYVSAETIQAEEVSGK